MAKFRARQNVERKKQTLCKKLGASEPGSLAPIKNFLLFFLLGILFFHYPQKNHNSSQKNR